MRLKTLKEFLIENPWSKEWKSISKPVEYFFTYKVSAAPDDLWPFLSDTSKLNKNLGLSSIKFKEQEGILRGSAKIGGFLHEWIEVPWQWEYGHVLKSERIYSKGNIKYVRAIFLIDEIDETSSYVYIYIGWIPGSLWGRWMLRLSKNNIEKRYKKVIMTFEDSLVSQMPIYVNTNKHVSKTSKSPKKNIDFSRIRAIRNNLQKKGLDLEVVEKLESYVMSASDNELYRMRPLGLAKKFRIDYKVLLLTMLHAVREGLLNMSWDIICPHCMGIRERASHLWEVVPKVNCDVCQIDFDTSAINSIEITFYPHPEIRPVEEILYCSAEPAKKPHIKVQRRLVPGEQYTVKLDFPEGRYRMRLHGQKSYNLLELIEDAEQNKIYWDMNYRNGQITAKPGSSLLMENNSTRDNRFIVEENNIDSLALRPGDLFNYQDFRDLFSKEALSMDLSIDVGIQNIVFVDIVGSTDLYEREGNSGAFGMVRRYFRICHELAIKFSGAIVKTMGDAVMFSFLEPLDALKASLKLMTILNGKRSDVPLRIRITINRGPCLAVNLNSSIDYFGQPVNIVAKLQKLTDAGEIVFTEEFSKDKYVASYLNKKGLNLKNKKNVDVKGAGEVVYYKIHVFKR